MFNPCSMDNESVTKMVIEDINELQEDGQEVEIQYDTTWMGDSKILYSGLIVEIKER